MLTPASEITGYWNTVCLVQTQDGWIPRENLYVDQNGRNG